MTETGPPDNNRRKPGETLRGVLADMPLEDRLPFVAWVEQRVRREADLEMLGEIRAYRQSLTSRGQRAARARLDEALPTDDAVEPARSLQHVVADMSAAERRPFLDWAERLARKATDKQLLDEINMCRQWLGLPAPPPRLILISTTPERSDH